MEIFATVSPAPATPTLIMTPATFHHGPGVPLLEHLKRALSPSFSVPAEEHGQRAAECATQWILNDWLPRRLTAHQRIFRPGIWCFVARPTTNIRRTKLNLQTLELVSESGNQDSPRSSWRPVKAFVCIHPHQRPKSDYEASPRRGKIK